MAVIDVNSVLRLVDLGNKVQRDELTNFKRNDVWDVAWSLDNPDTFITMEKIKMNIFRDITPEVPSFPLVLVTCPTRIELEIINNRKS